MSKMKQIAALTAMLVGVIMYASPAKSAVCFLPDDDGSCGGGDIEISDGSDSDDNKTEEKCEDFPVSATEYEKMKNCFDFTPCTKSKTNEVKYKKGAQKENTTWSNGICCTNGEKYFSKQGQCCPTTGCTCSGGRVWNPSTEQCECPEGKEFVGGVCTCAGNTVPDSDGNCILPAGCTYEYRQATTADSCGLTDLNKNYQCASTINGCTCYTQLKKVSSVWVFMTGDVTLFNKISNKSATCVDENNVTRYQTICQGTPKSKCSTGYEFKPNGCVSDTYNNGFEVKGDEWGDCVKKEEKCLYKYTHLTDGITYYTRGGLDGQTLRFGKNGDQCYTEGFKTTRTFTCAWYNGTYRCGGLDGPECTNHGGSCEVERTCQKHYNCERGTNCWDILSANKSIEKGGMGYPYIATIYNKISNTSASCTTIYDETKYETLCEGTLRSRCRKKFTPNGCESDSYSIYSVYDNTVINVVGDKFGDCGCDTSNGLYETDDDCLKANESQSLKCTVKGECYQTCEAAGKYSTKEACKKASPKYTECKSEADGRCYVPIKKGWGIHYGANYENAYDRTYICYDGNVPMDTSWTVSVLVRNEPFIDWKDAEDLNGDTYTYIHEAKGELRYPAGEYKISLGTEWKRYMYVDRMTLRKGSGEYCIYEWNSLAGQYDFETTGDFCSATVDAIGRNIIGIFATFEEGEEYYVTASMSPNGYECKLKKYVYPNHQNVVKGGVDLSPFEKEKFSKEVMQTHKIKS